MTITINENEYNINEKFTVKQFMKLLAFDINIESNWERIISIAFNIPFDEVLLIPQHMIELSISFILVFINNISEDYIKDMVELNNLTLAQFIDLDVYHSMGLHNTLDKMIEILFINSDPSNYINEYWGGVIFYIKWREQLFKKYKNLFNNDDESENNNIKPTDNLTARSWYNLLAYLSDDDLLKMDLILEKNIIAVLNFMSYKKTKNLNELRKHNRGNN